MAFIKYSDAVISKVIVGNKQFTPEELEEMENKKNKSKKDKSENK